MSEGTAARATEDEDEAGSRWADWIAKEWAADLEDPRQDIYSLDDGQPVEADSPLVSAPRATIPES